MLRGSLLKFEAVGTADAFFAAVPTSGEVVFGAGDRAKLGFHKSGGTGAMTKMTGTELAAAGLTHCISGVLSGVQRLSGIRRPGSKAHLVTVDGRHATLTPIGAHEGGLKNIAVAIDGGQPQVLTTFRRGHSSVDQYVLAYLAGRRGDRAQGRRSALG